MDPIDAVRRRRPNRRLSDGRIVTMLDADDDWLADLVFVDSDLTE